MVLRKLMSGGGGPWYAGIAGVFAGIFYMAPGATQRDNSRDSSWETRKKAQEKLAEVTS